MEPNGTQSSTTRLSAISVRNLRKVYEVPERESGLKAAVGSLFYS